MPYKKVESYEYVKLKCNKINCVNNKAGECDCDEDIEELLENDQACSFYSISFCGGEEYKFHNEEELHQFETECEDYKVIHVDEWSLRIIFKEAEGSNGKAGAFIRVKKKDENNYEYRPSTDGSIIVVDKKQTELFPKR